MCGIVGVFNNQDAFKQVKTALAVLKNRGKDGFGISSLSYLQHDQDLKNFKEPKEKKESKETTETPPNFLGHSLHAIVDHIPQPIKGKGTLTANCEIYNWKELNEKYGFNSKNDAELLLQFLDKFKLQKLDELDGVYAFAYWDDDRVYLARDLMGVKPLWFSQGSDNFAFASERKALEKIGYLDIQELNPRQMIVYDLKKREIQFLLRGFFSYLPEHKDSYVEFKKKTQALLDEAIRKRIPSKKFGLLFSGGIDSTYLAKYFKDQRYDFTCYTAVLETEESLSTVLPSDLVYAKKASEEFGLDLKIKKIKVQDLPIYLKKIIPLIEDSNVVKVGVALTFYLACELAKEDGCKIIFSGLGSEEIFAGYERHKNSSNINQECLSGLRKMYERDLYRDDVLTMDNNLELRLPFLDKRLVDYALKIPEKYKVKDNVSKFILREISLSKKIPEEFSFRKKTAAQYGSRFDYALGRLAKQTGFSSKSSYLKTFYPEHNLRLGVLFSGGKDSTYSAYIMQKQNYQLSCLITLKSKNPDSYLFHTPAIELAELQAEALQLPIIIQETEGKKEVELKDLEQALLTAKKKHQINGLITGAVFSTYQRDRIEKTGDQLGLKIFSPLWHKPQEQLMQELLDHDFKFMMTSVAAEGLDKSWLNKIITQKELEELKKLNKKFGFHQAGEGGEFESLVLDCPLFKKALVLEKVEVLEEDQNTARLIIKKAHLIDK
ncbi:MAG: diphthine--ammonia ligase [Nanoarchaeota archaeon]|nr:diphthine--ammonia ligase [Nanoarchaeota archaeon]MBU1643874.1 diphthine--ammonia ligase [Nanoarchaeota archaeon]MBU1977215.1 diphthine--ammonia ligase [Nanoarchaeota archaeon]